MLENISPLGATNMSNVGPPLTVIVPLQFALTVYELDQRWDVRFENLSGGQLARLQILLLELRGSTMLALDEPTDNLDVASAEALEHALLEYTGTVIAVSHDRWFLRGLDRSLEFRRDGSVVGSHVAMVARRFSNGWREHLAFVTPDTVVRWHRQGWRLFWRWKSRARSGRPHLSAEVRELIACMSRDNHLWGTERIRGELLKLGIVVSNRSIRRYR
jgi:energy-coupling factor transporter ATP-binding protein EcfA2